MDRHKTRNFWRWGLTVWLIDRWCASASASASNGNNGGSDMELFGEGIECGFEKDSVSDYRANITHTAIVLCLSLNAKKMMYVKGMGLLDCFYCGLHLERGITHSNRLLMM